MPAQSKELTAHGAAVITFDFMFSAPDPDNDDAFAAALRKARCVVLLRGLERRFVGSGSSIEIDAPIDPIPKLAEAAAAIAPFPLPKVPPRVGRFWTFHGVAGAPTVPSVVLQLAARDIARHWASCSPQSQISRNSISRIGRVQMSPLRCDGCT